jgi:plasmid stabilization system protein ParE
MSGYAFHPEAFTDLDQIWEYIAERNLDLTSRPLRFKLVRDYLIAYAPDEGPLWVVAVIHGSRNPRVMAAILRGREEETR